MEINRIFRKKLLEVLENGSFSDAYVHEKIAQVLQENEFLVTNELKESSTLSQLINDSLHYLKSENREFEFKSGISNLDEVTGGFGMGEFILIGARPAMGKSKFLQYMMLEGARKFPVLYFALDTGKDNFVHSLISSLTEINYSEFKKKNISSEQWKLIERVKDELENLPIYISDETSKSMLAFKSYCNRYIDEMGVKAIFIDFLQLMESNRYRHQRELELGYISRELKKLAREKNVCIMVTCQLSRSCEYRGGDKRPILSDLRESGSFEQDADKVLFLYRPEYYGFDEDENGDSTRNIMEIDVAKNRNGYIGSVQVKHNLPFGGIIPFVPFERKIQFSPDRLREIEEDDAPF